MSKPLATYSFLPWLRQGVANQITAADLDPGVPLRAIIHVELQLTGEAVGGGGVSRPVPKDVLLFGPGDIVGIDSRAIHRTEPRNWTTNFEPNFLPHIEFYDEDFPWRYTPAAPDLARSRLRPWIMLIVLSEDEFNDGKDIRNRPLPYIEIADTSKLPPAEQLWAWAHVHVNRSLAAGDSEFVSTDMRAVLPKLEAALNENPDLGFSRLLCPRKLAEDTAYHAFLIPVFESGRLAGLGLDPATSPNATHSAWAAYPAGPRPRPEPKNFPFYFRWYFRTSATGDFESLVRLLKPMEVDKRVGTRDMDVQHPGSNLPGINDKELGGILKLGGALRVPREAYTPDELKEVDKYEKWATPYPRPFQEALAKLINLADDYAEQDAKQANKKAGDPAQGPDTSPTVGDNPDPLITPPLYATWHSLTGRLLWDRAARPVSPNNNWVHELNLDPRYRVAAGFGTDVAQDGREKYMKAAWEQIGKVLEANQRIRLAQFAIAINSDWYDRHLVPLSHADLEKGIQLTAPMHKRVLSGGVTVHQQLTQSPVQPALTSVAFRRAVRPRGRLSRPAQVQGTGRPDPLIVRVNLGAVSAAPPRQTPVGLITINQVADQLVPTGPYAVFIREENHRPETVDLLPKNPQFVISDPDRPGDAPRPDSVDSDTGIRFKKALKDCYWTIEESKKAGGPVVREPKDLPGILDDILTSLDPRVTIPRRVRKFIDLPDRIKDEIGTDFVEAMAYPEIDTPMYEPLTKISAELFLPNIDFIHNNSITLLESNQKFIEAYMVGLNHQFARELLWREYPTDQRGSYFRQFWDVSGFFNSLNLDEETLKERLRDITPIHKWPKPSALGDHDNRKLSGGKGADVILTIRGELLKRYPTAVIYAHRARWKTKGDGTIDNTKPRELEELDAAEEPSPPRAKVLTPLFEAKVDPDIYFFGFDLTIEKARGGTGEKPTDAAGWFFVIKERPGEPRFDLAISKQPDLEIWNDLSWDDLQPLAPGGYLQITNATPTLTVAEPTDPVKRDEKLEQHNDDKNISWSKDMSAADLAYVLLKEPVLMAVHAAELLPKD